MNDGDAEALLEASLIVGPSLVLLAQGGVLLALFVMLPLVYGVDQSVRQISLFDPLRSHEDGEVVEAEIVDEE